MSLTGALIGQCQSCGGNLTAGHDCLQKAVPAVPEKPKKGSYIGAPAIFALEQACEQVNAAFGGFGCYIVGSALERPDWRDIDVRYLMPDKEFAREFPDSYDNGAWEFNPRWLLLTVSISNWLKAQTGLPVDFQFQPQSWANERHKKPRNPVGRRMIKRDDLLSDSQRSVVCSEQTKDNASP